MQSDTIIFGILALTLGLVFYTQTLRHFKRFYQIVPGVLLCYLLPAVYVFFGWIDPSESNIYFITSRYLLPAALVLMTLGIDLKAVLRLGPKALILFSAGTLSIILGGPIALLITGSIWPELLELQGQDAIWRGLATIAGSWIGGGANQAAMLEVFDYNKTLYGAMVLVDVIIANTWLAVLLVLVGKKDRIDAWLKADNRAINSLILKMEGYENKVKRIANTPDLMMLLGVSFGAVSLSHIAGEQITTRLPQLFPALTEPTHILYSITSPFLWMVLIATLIGLLLSQSPMRSLEGVGASKFGSVFIYLLVASIGMQIDLKVIGEQPQLLVLGAFWIGIHALVLFLVAKWIKAPYFFVAIGSQANVGGAASAPVIAASFHPSLSSVGILLAICGYVAGTIGAYICALLLQASYTL